MISHIWSTSPCLYDCHPSGATSSCPRSTPVVSRWSPHAWPSSASWRAQSNVSRASFPSLPAGSAVLTAHFTSTERLCFTCRLLCHPSPPNLPSPHPPYAQGQASFGQLGLREREGSSEADKSGFESWITFLATCPWSHCLDSRSPRLPTSKTRLTERRCEHEPEAAARAQARCEHRHKSATS